MKKSTSIAVISILLMFCVVISLVACNDVSYTITFDANGGLGQMSALQVKSENEATLPNNSFTRENYTFAGWATSADGEAVYADGSTITAERDLTLYAVWNIVTYTVNFDSNGGNGEMSAMSVNADEGKKLTANAFTKDNYTFAGWATSANGEVVYADGAEIAATSDLMLYAVWTRNALTANVTAVQKDNNEKITISWSNASETLTKVEIKAYRGAELVASKTVTDANSIADGTANLEVYWGKYSVNVVLTGTEETSVATYNVKANVSTNQYNIAFFNATFPVSIFTLHKMDLDSTALSAGTSAENTYVWLSRNKAYDWDNLPANVKEIPVANHTVAWNQALANTKAWIAELSEINKDAHFTVYCTDNYSRIIAELLINNGIGAEKWNAIMFTDGTWTANNLNDLFGNENAETTYNAMATAWNEYVAGERAMKDLPSYRASLSIYAPVIVKEMDNVKWFTGRLRVNENVVNNTFLANFLTELKGAGKIKENYLNSLLAALNADEKANFKALYHIDENTFAEAETANKKVMMILGTSWGGEAATLEDYMRATMQVYGTDYVYYYKGHPGYPTSNYAERQAILNRLKAEGYALYELDNSIAAEFFLFFFEDIEMIGYPSTTFESGTDANADGVFGYTKASEYYAQLLETYISKITDVSAFNETYSDKGLTLTEGGNYYLVEYKDEMANGKDLAIYDATTKTLANYKLISATVTAAQKDNDEKITVSWSNASETLTKVEINAYHGTELVASKAVTNASEIASGSADIDAYWGKFNVKVVLHGAEEIAVATYNVNVNVSTDKYSIAFFNGTFPVSIFTLHKMDLDSTAIAAGTSAEKTYVWLSRGNAYDWNNLPSNIGEMPVAKHNITWNTAFSRVKAWVAELNEISENAHFTVYCTDNFSRVLAEFMINNGIPVENWDAVMFTDGTWTANNLNSMFGNENAEETYNTMATAWNKYVAGEIAMKELPSYSAGMSLYAPIIAKEMANVKWFTGRLRVNENVVNNTFLANFLTELKGAGKIKENYLNSLLAALTVEEKATFKALYHIDENTFAEATTENKKVMMILGTSWAGEAATLEDYMRATMQVYGTDYVYYYKGHPGYPTSNYPERQAILNRLKAEGYALYELDNSIAAEFFLFFFEDIEMIGYPSTTFESGTDANADGVFGYTKASEYYAQLLETYISKITDVSAFNETYSDKGLTLTEGGNYYLVEYKDEMANGKDLAIYDATTKTLANYKLIDGTYQAI